MEDHLRHWIRVALATCLVTVGLIGIPAGVASAYVVGHCGGYATGGGQVEVCHNPADQGEYFATPSDEIAYNVQVLQIGSQYVDVYHSESLKSHDPNCSSPANDNWCQTGDSVKAAIGTDPYQMPAQRNFVLWGQYTDPTKYNYYGPPAGVGGGGNPMTVAGPPGDPYYYTLYLETYGQDATYSPTSSGCENCRNYLLMSRTTDFQTYQVWSYLPTGGEGWQTESATTYPVPVTDSAGNVIDTNNAGDTEGLIGSISYVNGLYYYFYTDDVPGGATGDEQLYYRTTPNIAVDGSWSPAQAVSTETLPTTELRVAKAYGQNRWVVLYNCYRQDTDGNQDLCMQYTQNLNVVGAGGLSSLTLFGSVTSSNAGESVEYLGLGSGASDFGSPDWVTDPYGNLPATDPEVLWTDMVNSTTPTIQVYGAPVYWATVQVYPGGQATLSQPGDSAVLTGIVGPNGPYTQSACNPPESDPTCWRFDVYVSGPLASTGTIDTLLTEVSWDLGMTADIFQVTAYNSAGQQLGTARNIGDECNVVEAPTGGAASAPVCPVDGTSLDIPLSSVPDGHVTFIVMAAQAWSLSDFRLDMQLAGTPAPSVPETNLVAGLPVLGFAFAALLLLRRRRRAAVPQPA